jgi:hypothetical protein
MSAFNTIVPKFQAYLAKAFPVLDDDDIDAIIGNAAWECGRFEKLQELKPVVKGSRGGYGYMQWTGPRRRAYEAWCAKGRRDPASFEANMGFLEFELNGPEKRALAKIQAAVGLPAKTQVFMETFLRPGIPHLQGRIRAAQDARLLRAQRPRINPPVPTQPDLRKPVSAAPGGNADHYLNPIATQTATLGVLAWIASLFRRR